MTAANGSSWALKPPAATADTAAGADSPSTPDCDMRSTTSVPVLGLGEMLDDRILGLDSAHVFLVSAQAVAARAALVAEVGCGRGALIDTQAAGGAWQDLRGQGRLVVGIDIEE